MSVSASKYRTAVVCEQGEVYCWTTQKDPQQSSKQAGLPPPSSATAPGPSLSSSLTSHGHQSSTSPLKSLGSGLGPTAHAYTTRIALVVPERVPGLRRTSSVAVGEKHSLALISLALPPLPGPSGKVCSLHIGGQTPTRVPYRQPRSPSDHRREMEDEEGMESLSDDGDAFVDDIQLRPSAHASATILGLEAAAEGNEDEGGGASTPGDGSSSSIPSLQDIAQVSVAKQLVEPRCGAQDDDVMVHGLAISLGQCCV